MGVSELTASAVKAMSNISIGGQRGQADASGQTGAAPLVNRAGESHNTYVKSHAGSLVAWQPLDNQTIDLAKAERKLIFLHIGYKACHYCRLMSAESFNNAECAAVLNESFIPVIIDREERPDLDSVYMNYVQAVSNVGGWPLNLFLTPELEPVFGGTYWPGPGGSKRGGDEQDEEEPLDFPNIVKKVRNIWKDQEGRCRKEASEIVAQLREFAAEGTLGTRSISVPHSGIAPSGWAAPVSTEGLGEEKGTSVSSELDLDQLEEAYTHIAGTFDPVYGGFGLAPKFLTPPKLEFLFRLNQYLGSVQDVVGEKECQNATDMAVKTLRQIRDGALHDHIGLSGFSRCSVTPDWSIPNFEKLVTDNALLLSLFTAAWRVNGGAATSEFYDVVIELANYLSTTPVISADGLFISSEAADSVSKKGDTEAKEGAFYLWTRREFDSVIEAAEKGASQIAAAYWNVLEDGNVDEDHDPNDEFVDQNILRIVRTPDELSQQFSIPVDKITQALEVARKALKERREKERGRPDLDDKAVAGWNGLVISALARAANSISSIDKALSAKYLAVASTAASFIRSKLWDADKKKLYRVWVASQRQTEGFADDYAYLIRGLLDLFEANGDESLVEFADQLQQSQTAQFYDKAGAFFTTAESAPQVILRLKDGMDTSLPSINAVSADNMFQLGQLLGDESFSKAARATINAFEAEMLQHPWLFPGLLNGVVTARLGVSGEQPSELAYKTTRQKA